MQWFHVLAGMVMNGGRFRITEAWGGIRTRVMLTGVTDAPGFAADLVYVLDFDWLFMHCGLKEFVRQSDLKHLTGTLHAFENLGYEPGVKILSGLVCLPDIRAYCSGRCGWLSVKALRLIAGGEEYLLRSGYAESVWWYLQRYAAGKGRLEITGQAA